jgi:hypothetical protein
MRGSVLRLITELLRTIFPVLYYALYCTVHTVLYFNRYLSCVEDTFDCTSRSWSCG